MLPCEGVTKAYGGLVALRDLTFAVRHGEIFAIVGPNGAGKTTLFDAISGISPATSGMIGFDGHEIQRFRPNRVCQLGIARTFQTTAFFGTQTHLRQHPVRTVDMTGTSVTDERFYHYS